MAFVVVCKPELAAELRPMTLRDGPEKWERTLFFIVLQRKEDGQKNVVERSNLFAKTVFSRSN